MRKKENKFFGIKLFLFALIGISVFSVSAISAEARTWTYYPTTNQAWTDAGYYNEVTANFGGDLGATVNPGTSVRLNVISHVTWCGNDGSSAAIWSWLGVEGVRKPAQTLASNGTSIESGWFCDNIGGQPAGLQPYLYDWCPSRTPLGTGSTVQVGFDPAHTIFISDYRDNLSTTVQPHYTAYGATQTRTADVWVRFYGGRLAAGIADSGWKNWVPSYYVNTSQPDGRLDSANCSTLVGWACTPYKLSTTINVDVYRGTTYVGRYPANVTRSDISSYCGGTTNHGFSIATPAALKTGTNQSVNVYAIDGTNPLLPGSPMVINCPAPVNGACGSAAVTYAWSAVNFSGSYCASPYPPSPAPTFPSSTGGSVSWTCPGANGGTNASCIARRNYAPPNTPTMGGPATATTNVSVSYTVTATDNNTTKQNLVYLIDWNNDGTVDQTTASVASGATLTVPHTYSAPGTYTYKAYARNSSGLTSGWSATRTVVVSNLVNGVCGTAATTYAWNATALSGTTCSGGTLSGTAVFPSSTGGYDSWQCLGSGGGASPTCYAYRNFAPPNTPTIGGSTSGFVNTPLTITFTATDRNTAPQPIQYGYSFDGGATTWTSPVTSGTMVTITKTFTTAGTHTVSVYTMNEEGLTSPTSASRSLSLALNPVPGIINSGACRDYQPTETAFTLPLCSQGTADTDTSDPVVTPTLPAPGTSYIYYCRGSNGGATVSCTGHSHLSATCGTATKTSRITQPTANLCNPTTVAAVWAVPPSSNGYWRWTCGTVSCTAKKSIFSFGEK